MKLYDNIGSLRLLNVRIYLDDVNVVYIPAKQIAADNGDDRLGNMVMTGKLIEIMKEIPLKDIEQSMRDNISKSKADLADFNIKMLESGYNFKG